MKHGCQPPGLLWSLINDTIWSPPLHMGPETRGCCCRPASHCLNVSRSSVYIVVNWFFWGGFWTCGEHFSICFPRIICILIKNVLLIKAGFGKSQPKLWVGQHKMLFKREKKENWMNFNIKENEWDRWERGKCCKRSVDLLWAGKNKPAALIQILGEPARRSQSGVLSLASSIGEPTIRASLLTNSLLF